MIELHQIEDSWPWQSGMPAVYGAQMTRNPLLQIMVML